MGSGDRTSVSRLHDNTLLTELSPQPCITIFKPCCLSADSISCPLTFPCSQCSSFLCHTTDSIVKSMLQVTRSWILRLEYGLAEHKATSVPIASHSEATLHKHSSQAGITVFSACTAQDTDSISDGVATHRCSTTCLPLFRVSPEC